MDVELWKNGDFWLSQSVFSGSLGANSPYNSFTAIFYNAVATNVYTARIYNGDISSRSTLANTANPNVTLSAFRFKNAGE